MVSSFSYFGTVPELFSYGLLDCRSGNEQTIFDCNHADTYPGCGPYYGAGVICALTITTTPTTTTWRTTTTTAWFDNHSDHNCK